MKRKRTHDSVKEIALMTPSCIKQLQVEKLLDVVQTKSAVERLEHTVSYRLEVSVDRLNGNAVFNHVQRLTNSLDDGGRHTRCHEGLQLLSQVEGESTLDLLEGSCHDEVELLFDLVEAETVFDIVNDIADTAEDTVGSCSC